MNQIKKIVFIGFIGYLLYVFIFSVLIFAIQKPNVGKDIETPFYDLHNSEDINRDRAALVESGEDGAIARINLLENAQKSIDMSYYTFTEGDFTDIVLGSIIEAADKGIEVRILLDGISRIYALRGDFKDQLFGLQLHPNIKLKFYEPLNPLFPLTWNNRLHDKLIIVDENLALIGGRNIGDKYYLEDIEKEDFSKDRDALIYKDVSSGDYASVIEDMHNYFEKSWNYKNSKYLTKKLTSKQKDRGKISNEELRYKYLQLKKKHEEKLKSLNWVDYTMSTEGIMFVHNPIGRLNKDPWCLKKLLSLSSQAKKSIFIQSPYIIPSRKMASEFNEYDIDLNKIKMLTNSYCSSPNILGISGYSKHRENIIDHNVEIYEFQGEGSIHSKTCIFDDSISVIGTFNFDARSSYINTESMVIIHSKEFADKLKKNVQVDLNKSLRVDEDYSYIFDDKIKEGEVSRLKKIVIAFLSKITPFFEHLL